MDPLQLSNCSFGFDVAFCDKLSPALAMHSHAFHEMVYVFSGRGKHITEHGTYDMEPGGLFIVRPGALHAYADRSHVKLVNIMFDLNRLPYPTELLRMDPAFRAFFDFGQELDDKFLYRNRLVLLDEDRQRMEKLLYEIRSEYVAQRIGRQACLIALLTELFIHIARVCGSKRYTVTRNLILLERISTFLKKNPDHPLTIPELAKRYGLSQKSLEWLFQDSMQCTPNAYCIKLRLEKAIPLLMDSSYSITEIAYLCGFYDSSYFSKMFRKKFGISPRDFQRNHKHPHP